MRIETITPVHIGTGEKYGPLDFFIDKRTLYRVDFGRFISELEPARRSHVLQCLKEEKYTEIQKMYRDEYSLYSASLRSNINPRDVSEVRESMKTLDGRPYIPGSSLKGAIRTGLFLYYAFHVEKAKKITGMDIVEDVKKEVRNCGGRIDKKRVGEQLEKRFFFIGSSENRKTDAKYDLFRFVHVSDFMPVQTKIYLDQIITYSQQRDGTLAPKHFKIHAETVEGSFEGEIRLDVIGIKRALESREYPLLKKKLELFGLTEDDLDSEKVQESFLKNLIRRATESRGEAYMHDLDLYKGLQNNAELVDFLLEELSDLKNKLRIGFGAGTHFQGIIKAIEKRDPDFAVRIINEFSKRNRFVKDGGIVPPYPKSIELTSENKPLGWLKVVTP